MNILAIDSSVAVLSAALAGESGTFYTEIDAGTRHSELLMECIDGLLKSSGLRPEDLNRLACMQGPGSFTGLRIGFSAAKGLAQALGIPLTPVPTLDCMAYPLSIWPGIIIPSIDAKKGCVFTALYRRGERVSEYMDLSPEHLAEKVTEKRIFPEEPLILTGPGTGILLPFMSDFPSPVQVDPLFNRGRARELLEIAKSSILSLESVSNSEPLYLRKSDAELKLE